MDVLKVARRTNRRIFITACNAFDEEENKLSSDEKISRLKTIEQKANIMVEVEYQVRDLLFIEEENEDAIDKEIDESEDFIDRWRTLQQKLETLSVSEIVDTKPKVHVSKHNSFLHYPKLQLPTFNGEIKNWLHFWGQFEKIDQDPNLDLHDKFAYLAQAMEKGSVADDLIKSFPPGGLSYDKAVNQLKSRFAREELLIEHYVRDLLGLVLQKQNAWKHNSLRKLYDALESKLRALETLGVVREKYAAMLYPLVESSIPDDILRVWERHRSACRRLTDNCDDLRSEAASEKGSKTDLDNLLDFLQDEVETEERVTLASRSFEKTCRSRFTRNKENVDESQISTAADLLNSSKRKYAGDKSYFNYELCIFCEKRHASEKCFKAMSMPFDVKKNLIQKSGACFLCLKTNHIARNCKAKVKCIICGKNHLSLMCSKVSEKSKPEVAEVDTVGKEDNVLTNQGSIMSSAVLLQTLVVCLKNKNKQIYIRAIIDTGSEKTYITKDIIQDLGFKSTNEVKLIHKLFGGVETKETLHKQYKVKVASVDGKYECQLMCLDQNVICSNIRKVPNGIWMSELNKYGITLSDSEESVLNASTEIKLLIGSDVAGKLMTGGRKILSNGLVAMETLLGWCLMGKIPEDRNHESVAMTVTSLLLESLKVEDLWNLDIIGITDPVSKQSKEENDLKIKEDFLNSVKINEEGRYEVKLPWKEEHVYLPSNLILSQKRLERTTKKMHEDNLYLEYENVFNEWLSLGIIEEIPDKDEGSEPVHYLPHRAVIKEGSSTKIRPVFDASAREKGYPSLNQCLEPGPNLIELIPSILLRFRQYQYGVTADIEKAFLQICVRKSDRDFLRFLWKSKDANLLRTFRHTRVVFGIVSSPFLLGAVIEFHLKKCLKEVKYSSIILNHLLKGFYVDNLVTSLENIEELEPFIKNSTEIMSDGKFNLRAWQWTGNESGIKTPLLGLIWNQSKDTLEVNLKWLEGLQMKEVTKRLILSLAHKVFDPIGYLSPVLLTPKLLLQKIWKTGLTWDEAVDECTSQDFRKWIEDLHRLKDVQIERWIKLSNNKKQDISIHTFCDASQLAYAAVVYLRVCDNAKVYLHLLASKTRVTPTKPVTIPRLELMAALVGARLCSSVLEGLSNVSDIKLHFWTDSSTTLTWIQKEENWTKFVDNRVKEIRKISKKEDWRHLPGTLNPADLPSRGCCASTLLETRWWEGPHWLKKNQDSWPVTDLILDEKVVNEEKRKAEKKSTSLTTQSEICEWCSGQVTEVSSSCVYHGLVWYSRYFSNYDRIVRLIGWLMRFQYNCTHPKEVRRYGELSYKEYQSAEKKLIKIVQEESFTSETDKVLKSLSVLKDDEGLLRLKTKIDYRKDSSDFRRPMVLPSNHVVVHRLIWTEHLKSSHAGTQILLGILREHYWILNARKTIRKVISKCNICRRQAGDHCNAPSAPLTERRVRDAAVFEICGVDLAGPIYLRKGVKGWICLFTCAIYRAVHLELLTSASTEAFIQSLRRFIGRRGRPATICCDNGSNFVGAHNAFKDLDWDQIVKYSVARRIEWKFNPPSAPWWGGWWERLISIMKQLLKKVLGRSILSYEEMNTILIDTEAIINSRPLTYISDSNDEVCAISPSMFLQDVKEYGVPDCDLIDAKSISRRLIYRQKLLVDLRKRFRSEYLGFLIQRIESKRKCPSVKVGDIVIIGCDNIKRIDWPLGRITELIPGKDKIVRLAKVQTSSKELLRPIQRIYPLEVSSSWVECVDCQDPINQPKPDNQTVSVGLKNLETLTRSTRSGRLVKIPKRLDL